MNKPVLGMLLGGVLGFVDGVSAFMYPEVASQMTGIIIGSTFKGVITGLAAGFVARKVKSVPIGILVGLLVGLLLSFLVALGGDEQGRHYYFEIMVPGSIVGAIVGWATQKYPRGSRTAEAGNAG